MNRLALFSLVLVAAVLAGCSSTARRGTPAPVEDVGVSVVPPARSSQDAAKLDNKVERPRFDAQDEVSRPTTPGPVPEPTPVKARHSKAVLALVDDAERLQGSREFNRAAASLERALRIEPRNPYLWNRLARLRLEQGQYGEAADLAAKSNAWAGNNATLKTDNWRMIAAVRRSAGDLAGARAAEHKADRLGAD
jgi:tetratricopeptide (TPR) repeat protein